MPERRSAPPVGVKTANSARRRSSAPPQNCQGRGSLSNTQAASNPRLNSLAHNAPSRFGLRRSRRRPRPLGGHWPRPPSRGRARVPTRLRRRDRQDEGRRLRPHGGPDGGARAQVQRGRRSDAQPPLALRDRGQAQRGDAQFAPGRCTPRAAALRSQASRAPCAQANDLASGRGRTRSSRSSPTASSSSTTSRRSRRTRRGASTASTRGRASTAHSTTASTRARAPSSTSSTRGSGSRTPTLAAARRPAGRRAARRAPRARAARRTPSRA